MGINIQTTAIEKYKKAIARVKEKESMLGAKPQSASASADASKANASKDVLEAAVGFAGTRLVDNDVEYSALLEQTVQSLRRKVTELTMSRKLADCTLSLKPLPFSLMRDRVSRRTKEAKAALKRRQSQRAQEREEEQRNKKEEAKRKKEEDGDDDAKDDEEAEAEDGEDEVFLKEMAEIAQMQSGMAKAAETQRQLAVLQGSLSSIISQPRVIDLTKKRQRNGCDLSQELVGRQMKLREVGMRYKEIKRSIETQAVVNNVQQEPSTNLGKALGTIRIPQSSLKSLGFDRDHKVLLPAQAFGRLQSSFMF